MSNWESVVKKILSEGRVIRLDHLNPNIVTGSTFIVNPTKQQFENLLQKDKYNLVRAFITDSDDLYVWSGYTLTHQEALDTLYKKGGYKLNPIIGLLLSNFEISKANSWKSNNMTPELKNKLLNNKHLSDLFGENYTIQNL